MKERFWRYVQTLDLPKKVRVLVTGGNSGIGFAFCQYAVRLGYDVTIATRSETRGKEAVAKLKEINPDCAVDFLPLDLAKPESTASFIRTVIERGLDYDVFYANAGVYRIPLQHDSDGFEMTEAVNFVGNLRLYDGLKDYFQSLNHPVKWILTSSIVARFASWDKEDLLGRKRYDKTKAYNRSKVAVNMLYLQMVDECKGTNVLPLLVHPGITLTPLMEKAYSGRRFKLAANRFLRTFFHSPDKAALSTLRLLDCGVVSPSFCGPRGPFHLSGYPKIYKLYRGNAKRYQKVISMLREFLNGNAKKYGFYGRIAAKTLSICPVYPKISDGLALYDLLRKCWSADTCAPRMRERWNEENPTLGQCSITAFLIQDLYGGEVWGIPLPEGGFHCFNRINGHEVDWTSEQFGSTRLDYASAIPQSRQDHFAKEEKRLRYETLKSRLHALVSE